MNLEPNDSTMEAPSPLTERRLVAVLFADLVGFTQRSEHQDPEDVATFLRSYFERVHDVIDRFGGIVEKYAGDAVMAVWGAQVATEDDAERAVRAGLEIHQRIAELAEEVGDAGLAVRIGIHTGETAVTVGGNESTGMIVGDIVNSASRLQTVAEPGTVLVGESTYRAASDAIAFEAAGVRDLKGRRESIATWRALRVIAERGGRGRVEGLDPPFVGRRAELQLLKDLLADVTRDRRARMVSIIGEVGIGKSRLVWELQKYADGLAAPVQWNQGRSRAYGTEGVASWALSDMLRRRIGATEDADDPSVSAALDASLDEFVGDSADRAQLRRWLGPLLCCGPTPEGDRLEFDAAIRRYFGFVAARGTTVLVFEDLQWADAGLLEFVEELASWMPDVPILVLALARPELLERRPGWSAGRHGVVSLRLGPLSEVEMSRLLEGTIGQLDPRRRAEIIERSAGVPLYAVELVRSLIAQGGRGPVDGAATKPIDLGSIALPETLQSLIGARIDRLEPEDRMLLQDAAILGSAFTLPELAAVSGRSEATLAERLEVLATHELVEPVRDPRSPRRGGFRFVQELVCEVARNRLSRDGRRVLHVAAARYTESLGGPDNAVVAADHYLSALSVTPVGAEADALRGQATGVLLSALDRAAALYANEEIISLGSKIVDLELDLPPGRLVGLYEQMAAAASALLRSDEAQAHVEHAMALSHRLGDEAGVRHAAALAAEIYLDHQETGRAVELLEVHLEGIDDLSAEPELAGLGAQLARAKAKSGDEEGALVAAERALIAAEKFGHVPVIGDALTTKAGILGIRGRVVESSMLFESVIELAERERLPIQAMGAYIDIGVLPEENLTRDPTLDAIELGRRVGNANFVLMASLNRAELMMRRGEWEEAESLLADPLWESAVGMALNVAKCYALATKDALRGRTADAQVIMREALETPDPRHRAGARATAVWDAEAALAKALIGELDAALDWAQDVLAQPESVMWIEPLVLVLLLAGSHQQLDALDAQDLVRGQAFDRDHRRFAGVLVTVVADDTTSLAAAERLIADISSRGYVAYELIWTIGMARWLPEGDVDRERLMRHARDRIGATGFDGLVRFLDP